VNSPFQQELNQLTFKTFYHNQIATFDYDDLFTNRRVIVFSLTQWRTTCSWDQTQGYIDNYDTFIKNNIDDVYAVDSTDPLMTAWLDKKTKKIKGLPDRDMKFVKALADHYNYQKETFDLARYWQYVVILNNGEPERIWHNPFKEDAPLYILKNQQHRYRKLSADVVLKYVIDNAN
jgi:peroxiredoxin